MTLGALDFHAFVGVGHGCLVATRGALDLKGHGESDGEQRLSMLLIIHQVLYRVQHAHAAGSALHYATSGPASAVARNPRPFEIRYSLRL